MYRPRFGRSACFKRENATFTCVAEVKDSSCDLFSSKSSCLLLPLLRSEVHKGIVQGFASEKAPKGSRDSTPLPPR